MGEENEKVDASVDSFDRVQQQKQKLPQQSQRKNEMSLVSFYFASISAISATGKKIRFDLYQRMIRLALQEMEIAYRSQEHNSETLLLHYKMLSKLIEYRQSNFVQIYDLYKTKKNSYQEYVVELEEEVSKQSTLLLNLKPSRKVNIDKESETETKTRTDTATEIETKIER